MASVRCPVCGKTFERSDSAAMPFCSERCRLIDLGRWMGERYSVPAERDRADEEASSDDSPVTSAD
jgi:endogenous inhibitor of DNA gyrase (YacG/DUF329 family)